MTDATVASSSGSATNSACWQWSMKSSVGDPLRVLGRARIGDDTFSLTPALSASTQPLTWLFADRAGISQSEILPGQRLSARPLSRGRVGCEGGRFGFGASKNRICGTPSALCAPNVVGDSRRRC